MNQGSSSSSPRLRSPSQGRHQSSAAPSASANSSTRSKNQSRRRRSTVTSRRQCAPRPPAGTRPIAGAGGEAAVHARDAVVAGAEKAAGRLQEDQGRDPGRRRCVGADPLLDPMILGGDEDVEIVRRANRGPMRIGAPRRHRRLHEGGLGHVLDHEPPGLVLCPVRGQPAQQVAPGLGIRHDRVVAGAVQRQGRELDAEAVPRCALVRPQERKVEHAVF